MKKNTFEHGTFPLQAAIKKYVYLSKISLSQVKLKIKDLERF